RPLVAPRLPIQKLDGKAGGGGGKSHQTSAGQWRTLSRARLVTVQAASGAGADLLVMAEAGGDAREERQAVKGAEGNELQGPSGSERDSDPQEREDGDYEMSDEDATEDDDSTLENDCADGDNDSDSDWAPSSGAGGGGGRRTSALRKPQAGVKGQTAGAGGNLKVEGVSEFEEEENDEGGGGGGGCGPVRNRKKGGGTGGRRMSIKLRLSGPRGTLGAVAG
ncbi:hypothetical protein Vafri_4517, partial [Volvox africanus]